MPYKPLFALLAICISLHAPAQTAATGKKAFYLHSYLGVGIPGASALNTALEGSGHLPLRSAYLSRGGGFYVFFNNSRLVQLFSFTTYTGNNTGGDRHNWARGTQVGSALGIDLKKQGRLQAVPYAGVAYSFFGLRVSSNGSSSGAFNSYLSGPSNQHHVSINQWLLNLGLHLGASPVGHSGLGQKLDIALRAGYHLPLSQGNWKTSEQQLSGGPEVNSGGFYAGLILGLRQ